MTDGQLSGRNNVGITVAEAAPEAAAGGPIGGDTISIDVEKRTADLEVGDDELADGAHVSPDDQPTDGFLALPY